MLNINILQQRPTRARIKKWTHTCTQTYIYLKQEEAVNPHEVYVMKSTNSSTEKGVSLQTNI